MKIPFINLKAQYESIKPEIDKAIQNVINDTAFIQGKYVQKFEEEFAEFNNVNHCVGVGNGTDAIYLALKALNIGKGDEVITAANTFIATAEAITRTGAQVVFVDCDETYNMNIDLISSKITTRTRAIIAVHLYGNVMDLIRLEILTEAYELKLIQDAAQAHNAYYNDFPIATFGDCTCFSFFPGKNLGAYGDGGAVVTNNPLIAKLVKMHANHGTEAKSCHLFEGTNSRLDGIQAAILSVKLKYLKNWTACRWEAAMNYNIYLKTANLILPKLVEQHSHVFHLYVIQSDHRDQLKNTLKKAGISTGIHYPTILPLSQAYHYLEHTAEEFPVAYKFSKKILSLPICSHITQEQQLHIAWNINEA